MPASSCPHPSSWRQLFQEERPGKKALLLRAEGELCSQEDTKHKLAPGCSQSVKERLPVTEFFPGIITSCTHAGTHTHRMGRGHSWPGSFVEKTTEDAQFPLGTPPASLDMWDGHRLAPSGRRVAVVSGA